MADTCSCLLLRQPELLAATYFLWYCHAALVTAALNCVLKSSDFNLAWPIVQITEYFYGKLS